MEENTENNDTPLTIPEAAYGPLRDLVEMSREDFDAFIASLITAEPSTSTVTLGRDIARRAPGIPRSVISAIVNEIMTLEFVKQDFEMSVDEFSSAMSLAALEVESEDFHFDNQDAEILNERLAKIFNSDHVFELSTKAVSVLADHDNLFLSAKILTDARPVFDEAGTKIEAFAIVHMLRIHVGHNQKQKDFFIALDVGDIPKLRNVIDRADKKAALLRNTLKATHVSYMDIESPDAED